MKQERYYLNLNVFNTKDLNDLVDVINRNKKVKIIKNNPLSIVDSKNKKIDFSIKNFDWNDDIEIEALKTFLKKIIKLSYNFAKDLIESDKTYKHMTITSVNILIDGLVNKWINNHEKITFLNMATNILHSLLCHHRFKDSNKRTALLSCVIFLIVNGYFISDDENIDWAIFLNTFLSRRMNGYFIDEFEELTYLKNFINNSLIINYEISVFHFIVNFSRTDYHQIIKIIQKNKSLMKGLEKLENQ